MNYKSINLSGMFLAKAAKEIDKLTAKAKSKGDKVKADFINDRPIKVKS
jgi:hypothetical protein